LRALSITKNTTPWAQQITRVAPFACPPSSHTHGLAAHMAGPPSDAPQQLVDNWALLNADEAAAAVLLLSAGQGHLFAAWPAPGERDDDKKRILAQARAPTRPACAYCSFPVSPPLGPVCCLPAFAPRRTPLRWALQQLLHVPV
jgi:hypothetical protein